MYVCVLGAYTPAQHQATEDRLLWGTNLSRPLHLLAFQMQTNCVEEIRKAHRHVSRRGREDTGKAASSVPTSPVTTRQQCPRLCDIRCSAKCVHSPVLPSVLGAGHSEQSGLIATGCHEEVK